MFPLRRSSLESAGWGSLEVEGERRVVAGGWRRVKLRVNDREREVALIHGPSGPADVAPLRAISVSVASLSPIAATPPSANANASVADLVEDAEDVEGHVHVSENVLLGDENDVFVMGISHAAAALVKVAPSFDAIEEWLAENEDYEVPMYDQPPVKVPAKHPSGGSDPSRVKRARSISSTSSLKDAYCRNDFLHNAHLQPSWLIVMNFEVMLRYYLHINSTTSSPTTLPVVHTLKWNPPSVGYTKINTEEAYNPMTHDAGIRVIARDNTGSLLGGLAQHSANC
ncbi:hypothetical protein V6N11_025682 [Hibiscus sabdariffa]|uniref:Uncharacterized protein n=1 Tax=Hibiscus sabdariffa TaxID=183260 RepID=A0ABR2STB9_9ROSI